MRKNFFPNAVRKISLLLLNNVVINSLFILVGKEEWIQHLAINWRKATYDASKSPEENVGFSVIPEIEESRGKMHTLLRETAQKHLRSGDKILEVGCGTGIFLMPLQNDYAVTGIDLSIDFLNHAAQRVTKGKFIEGDYLSMKLQDRYSLIYLESSLQYFTPHKLTALFKKFHDDLIPGGILLLHYSHALTLNDALYGDLAYVRYSPKVIEQKAKKHFSIINHHHYTDNRIVKWYDNHHYYFPGTSQKRTDTNLNTYVLIAQRLH